MAITCHMFFKQYVQSSRIMSHSGHITYTIMCTFKTIHCRYSQNSYTSTIKIQSKLDFENTHINLWLARRGYRSQHGENGHI